MAPIDTFTAARLRILEDLFEEEVADEQLTEKFRERSGGYTLDMFMGDWKRGSTDDVIVKFSAPNGDGEFIYIHTGDDPYYIPLVVADEGVYHHELPE